MLEEKKCLEKESMKLLRAEEGFMGSDVGFGPFKLSISLEKHQEM